MSTPFRFDPELIIWIFIVAVTAISQMVRAARMKPRRNPTSPARTQRPAPAAQQRVPLPKSDAQRELEEFIRNLTGMPPLTEEPPRPPPIPVPQPAAKPVVVVRQAPPPVKPARAPRVAVPAPPVRRGRDELVPTDPEPAPAPSAYRQAQRAAAAVVVEDPYAAERRTAAEKRLHNLRTALQNDLASLPALARGIVLREILDKPLALRQPAQS